MNTAYTTEAISRCTNILKFWHKVEFFIPFDLERLVLDSRGAEWRVRTFSVPQLNKIVKEALWCVTPPEGQRLIGFDVFFGIFDNSEMSEITSQVVHEAMTPEEEYEQDERGEMGGRTCFACIKMSTEGVPQLDEVSVSTAPWALGRIMQQGLSGLDFDVYQADIKTLGDDLSSFRAKRAQNAYTYPDDDSETEASQSAFEQSLSGTDLLEILDLFYGWAGFWPKSDSPNAPVIVIRANSVEDRPESSANKAKKTSPQNNEPDIEDEDDDAPLLEEIEIGILNSFYIRDIARAIISMEEGRACPVLQAYLTPVEAWARTDIYTPTGREQVMAGLQPDRLNAGHWLDLPNHVMSLMQQFAINSTFEQLRHTGVYSVNGPPGTGKTTLLRDIFAENIVRRAQALVKFEMACDAFHPQSVRVSFEDGTTCSIAVLREAVVGFEMVVASSNNAAVENISRDLLKSKSLGKAEKPGEPSWRDEDGRAVFGYLRQVARNMIARNRKGEYESLTPENDPWGLISCALGKKANRSAFVRGISFDVDSTSENKPKGFDEKQHQSIWSWRKRYKGLSYSQARLEFQKADLVVKSLTTQLDRYTSLYAQIHGQTEESFTAAEAQAERQAREEHANRLKELKSAEDERSLCISQLELLKSEERLIKTRRPRWLCWARFRKHQSYLDYSNDLKTNHSAQREWIRRKYMNEEPFRVAQKTAEEAESALRQAEKNLQGCRKVWQAKQNEFQQLVKLFPRAARPEHLDELEQEHWQIDGLWQSEILNAKRSQLFAAALQLHEAWLAEVLQKGGRFGSNVIALCNMLGDSRLQEREHALTIWRSLFMIVPVVSSTFASFARQFQDLDANTLGWLFIDEAGQAVPQAAVGALWRSKRAVVVGDPLQIEPVFTVPIKLIKALSRTSVLPTDMNVAPHQVSVQNLADEANPIGALIWVKGRDQWIGSPLRVHRRCNDPMFTIANKIAYAGKMIFFDPTDPQKRRPPKDSFDLGDSAWVHAPGVANNKQAVPTQIELVQQALVALYQRIGALPPIYIISPFKRIKDELIDRISRPENWNDLACAGVAPPKKSKLYEWCKARIGTVHTFQGKEESIVWMVLGCDDRMQGAANWAAYKPNLLNVSLTRAKHRFFMIGDTKLWGGLSHFVEASAGYLPRISPDEFLQRMELPTSLANDAPLIQVSGGAQIRMV